MTINALYVMEYLFTKALVKFYRIS